MNEDHMFFSAAVQYYVTGRYAVFAQLNPIAANLLHHAVEMLLKGYLSKTLSLQELKRLGHHLPRLWAECKALVINHNLDRLDTVVKKLNAFEGLRYPDSVLEKGAGTAIGVGPLSLSIATDGPPRPEPVYELCLEEVDELVQEIFSFSSVNPAAYACSLSFAAKNDLRRDNSHLVLAL
jgi:hypothetical protein